MRIQEGRELTLQCNSYLSVNPLVALGELNGLQQDEAYDFVTQHHIALQQGSLAHVDPLEINAAAFACLDLGYAACPRQEEGDDFTDASALAPWVGLSEDFFTALISQGETDKELHNDNQFYIAGLGRRALGLAKPQPHMAFPQRAAEQYRETVDLLRILQNRIRMRPNESRNDPVTRVLIGQRAMMLVAALLMRGSPQQAEALVVPASTRHAHSFASSLENNRYSLFAWQCPIDSSGSLSLITPPDAKIQVSHSRSKTYGPSITAINLVDGIMGGEPEVLAAVTKELTRSPSVRPNPAIQKMLDILTQRLVEKVFPISGNIGY